MELSDGKLVRFESSSASASGMALTPVLSNAWTDAKNGVLPATKV